MATNRYTKQEMRDRLQIERYRGEADGRLYGKIDERRLTIRWLRTQGAEASRLALLLDHGAHTKDPSLQTEGK